jgi:hypothetical protein
MKMHHCNEYSYHSKEKVSANWQLSSAEGHLFHIYILCINISTYKPLITRSHGSLVHSEGATKFLFWCVIEVMKAMDGKEGKERFLKRV